MHHTENLQKSALDYRIGAMLRQLSLASLLTLSVSAFALADEWQSPLPPETVPTELISAPDGLEVTIWAESPLLYNPTNIDIDAFGNIWVAEGVNYRKHAGRRPDGDRIAVLRDTNGDGRADSSHTFVQEKGLIAPLGVSVFDNKIVVPQPPDLLVYTDVDRDLKFDPEVDTREVLLSGFNAINHDHSFHAVTAGPDGKWYLNNGNCGAIFTDRSGKTYYMRSPYRDGKDNYVVDSNKIADKVSDDGHQWTAGFIARINPDGTDAQIYAHGMRNSYEHVNTSFGDIFQNDNDDPPACRTSFVMEYGNFGFWSLDSRRIWSVDRRPGEPTASAHWRQQNPGTIDAGDVYGGGSPTGVTFYENGALGDEYVGTLLSCEAGRNVIFSYQPQPNGAKFDLERGNFITSNQEKKATVTSDGRRIDVEGEALLRIQFRPSDVAVGADGALYISDWYDRRVGGHGDVDDSCSGTIYRVAPVGFKPQIPTVDRESISGLITLLRSPAKNVRYTGFIGLRERGSESLPAVQELMTDENPYIAARGIWLLPYLGDEGLAACKALLAHSDQRQRLIAFRALRAAGLDVIDHAITLCQDPDPAVRRDAALALRDQPISRIAPALLEVFERWDGADKNMLESIGLAAANAETEFWHLAKQTLQQNDPLTWTPKFAKLTWRLMTPDAVPDLLARAQSTDIAKDQRHLALDALAFITTAEAMQAMRTLHDDPFHQEMAKFWLINRAFGPWQDFGATDIITELGYYDPNAEVSSIVVPEPDPEAQLELDAVLALEGDAEKGAQTAMRCVMCHQINDIGPDYGPSLKGWGKTQSRDVIARSLIDPSADIAHGYTGWQIESEDRKLVHGLLTINNAHYEQIVSTGGISQTIPKAKIRKRTKLDRSLMLSADQLGLTEQDVADLVAWLEVYE